MVGKTYLLWAPQMAFIQVTVKPQTSGIVPGADIAPSWLWSARNVCVGGEGRCLEHPGQSGLNATWI